MRSREVVEEEVVVMVVEEEEEVVVMVMVVMCLCVWAGYVMVMGTSCYGLREGS